MIELLLEYGLFLLQTITLVVAIVATVTLVAAAAAKTKHKGPDGTLVVTHVNDQLDAYKEALESHLLNPFQQKALEKQKKCDEKARKAKEKKQVSQTPAKQGPDEASVSTEKSRLYVLDFNGDIKASQVDSLAKEVTAVLQVVTDADEILVRLESPGGVVHGYGLAAAQLARIKQRGLTLTVAVDKVAASGGYMMACLADRIIAAPFAILGSIGVIAQLPNFNKLLKKNDVDFDVYTAGEYKRTVTMFGENNEKGKAKFKQELEEAHQLFKAHVSEYRPSVTIETVATGEHWYGQQALGLNLVDELLTSDDYILQKSKDVDIYTVAYEQRKPLLERLSHEMQGAIERAVEKVLQGGMHR